jgi:hypothetical protein
MPGCEAQLACVAPQTDWTFVSVRSVGASDAGVDAAPAGCAMGWTNPRTLLDNVRASAATCACTCGAPASNPCANGTHNASFRTGTTSCNDGSANLDLDGACHGIAGFSSSINGVSVSPPTIAQVSCGATAALPPAIDDGALLVCDLAAGGAPIACPGGTCIPKPDPDKICILHTGDTATCPAAFPTKKIVAPSFTDGRTCGACSCTTNATTCTNRQIGFYTNGGCNQGERLSTVDNTCNDLSGSGSATFYQYKATANGSCVAAAATVAVTGALALTTPSTLCCGP